MLSVLSGLRIDDAVTTRTARFDTRLAAQDDPGGTSTPRTLSTAREMPRLHVRLSCDPGLRVWPPLAWPPLSPRASLRFPWPAAYVVASRALRSCRTNFGVSTRFLRQKTESKAFSHARQRKNWPLRPVFLL